MTTLINELKSLQPAELDAGQVFSGKPSGTLVKGYAQPSAYTPAIDPSYIFHESSRDVIVWLLGPQEPLYVFGPTGCGKTSCIKQLAARINYPVFEVTGHGGQKFAFKGDPVGQAVQGIISGPQCASLHYGFGIARCGEGIGRLFAAALENSH
ncbi:AAA family ATPase [Desulfovibrio sp. PG-178-WT-4]|uniref:AAA family ATPase n=1 Tax=Desulfovibrio porci TaxID=2605782 RepID=A0A6L5XMG0_9BACT|nr:AAA family ATPase [Desulfovibrio porci]MSS28362.1 AAA family ATPase [Desulfovibrio porci]